MNAAADYRAEDPYTLHAGVYVPPGDVVHREEEYDSRTFNIIRQMQLHHFWYVGRHRFLLRAMRRHLPRRDGRFRAIDLGGGCGGWLAYLKLREALGFSELALGDSSPIALQEAAGGLDPSIKRFQVDLLNLQWRNRWDIAFLLDVLEHLPDDSTALKQVYDALSPGGHLFVTVPALNIFWSQNDEFIGHQRRYSKSELNRVARESGFLSVDARYFMFLLSPIYLASRLNLSRAAAKDPVTDEGRWKLMESTHRLPNPIINAALKLAFCSETPIGHYLPFPWGTSLLGVFQKPGSNEI